MGTSPDDIPCEKVLVIERLKESWGRLRSEPAGERFQRSYERRHEEGVSAARRWGTIALGVAVLAAGIFFLPAPGPGMVIVAVGAGLIAQESSHAARLLDRAELLVRRVLGWGRDVYRRAPPVGRVLLIALGVAVAAGAAYGAYWFFFLR